MPFVDTNGQRLDPVPVELRQIGRGTFELLTCLVWVDSIEDARRHVVTPRAIGLTDLASVPWILWGLIASYGLHTPAALLHDMQCARAKRKRKNSKSAADRRASLSYRRSADRRFLMALDDLGVNRVRQFLMYTAVSIGTYKNFLPLLFWPLLVPHLLLVVVVIYGSILGIMGGFDVPAIHIQEVTIDLPAFDPLGMSVDLPFVGPFIVTRLELATLLLVPAVASVLWWRDRVVVCIASYAAALLLPVTVVTGLTSVTLWCLGRVVDPHSDRTIGPTVERSRIVLDPHAIADGAAPERSGEEPERE